MSFNPSPPHVQIGLLYKDNMGLLLDSTTSVIATVTRKSWARGLHAEQWETLVQEAASIGHSPQGKVEEEVCASLFQLLIEDTVGSGSCLGPLILDYIRYSINRKPYAAQGVAVEPLVRAEYMARSIVLLENRPIWALQAVMNVLAPVAADFQLSGSRNLYACSSLEDLSKGLLVLESEIGNCDDPETILDVIRYTQVLIRTPPYPFKRITTSNETNAKLLSAIRFSRDMLKSTKALGVSANTLFEAHISQLDFLDTLLAPSLQKTLLPNKCLDDLTETADPDVQFLISDLLHFSALPAGASSSDGAVCRLVSVMLHRISRPERRAGTQASACESCLLEILLATTADLRKDGGDTILHLSFAYSRMPELLKEAILQFSQNSTLSYEDIQKLLFNAVQRFTTIIQRLEAETKEANVEGTDSMVVDDTTKGDVADPLIAALCRQSLLSKDAARILSHGLDMDDVHFGSKSLSAQPTSGFSQSIANGDYETARSILKTFLNDHIATRSFTDDILISVESSVKNSGLDAIASLCSILLERRDTLDVVFLHNPPSTLLAPICTFLDAFDSSSESYGEEHAIEHYGKVVLFLEIALARHNLYDDLPRHLGNANGFFAQWLPSVSAVYSLPSLDEDTKLAVNGWVGGLFGEGISDDLIHSTNPRILLRAAPTICKQSLAACGAGVIDLDTLREGLSYFLQELLSFTLPGVLYWLIAEISRLPSSPAKANLFEIFKTFVLNESLPPTVLELVAPNLLRLAERLAATTPPDFDIAKLNKLLKPWQSTSSQGSRSSWTEQLWADVSAAVDAHKTIRPNLAVSLRSCLPNFAGQQGVRLLNSLLAHLRSNSKVVSSAGDDDAWLRESRLERIGIAVLSVPSGDSAKCPPLLYLWANYGLQEILSLARMVSPEDPEAQARLTLDADIMSAAFSTSIDLEVQRGQARGRTQVTKLLEGVAREVRKIETHPKSMSSRKPLPEFSALDFWFKKFMSSKLLQQIEALAELM